MLMITVIFNSKLKGSLLCLFTCIFHAIFFLNGLVPEVGIKYSTG